MIELDSLIGSIQFGEVMTEIISNFSEKPSVKVILKLDIEAHFEKPFDISLERTVKENGELFSASKAKDLRRNNE